MRNQIAILAVAATLVACGKQPEGQTAAPADVAFQKTLQERLLDAKPGDVIEIPAGKFSFDRSLSLRVDGVTIRGAGRDKTVLSFKGQKTGAEGLIVNASDFTLENLAIEDTKGDGVKVNEGKNIILRGVRVEWTKGPSTDNGAYGLYPVQTQNVLVEDCVVIGSRDAGIYVGQSKDVIVRNNRAEYNVAGIEIENTINADVYDNIATNNTGGILVFNMPELKQEGHTTRIYKNRVVKNNTDNFGAKGTSVAAVPAGSGIVIASNDKIEIFDNEIADNQTANVLIASFLSVNYEGKKMSEGYDPYPEEIHIYGNRFSGGGDAPDGLQYKTLKVAMFGLNGHFPDVFWDGYANPQRKQGPQICVEGASGVLNADNPNKNKNPSTDMAPFKCTLDKLPAVVLQKT